MTTATFKLALGQRFRDVDCARLLHASLHVKWHHKAAMVEQKPSPPEASSFRIKNKLNNKLRSPTNFCTGNT